MIILTNKKDFMQTVSQSKFILGLFTNLTRITVDSSPSSFKLKSISLDKVSILTWILLYIASQYFSCQLNALSLWLKEQKNAFFFFQSKKSLYRCIQSNLFIFLQWNKERNGVNRGQDFFYLAFLSRTFPIQRRASKGGSKSSSHSF